MRLARRLWFDESGMQIKCPKCGKESSFSDNPFRPFCSERCKLLDLGDWLSGSYSVPLAQDQGEGTQQESGGDTEDP